jgi:hypothetical protein
MIRVDASELVRSLRQLGPSLEAAARNILTEVASFAADAARTSPSFKDRSAALRGSIRRVVRGNFHQRIGVGIAGSSNAYAMFVETGTHPHVIRARNAKYLRFVQDGVVRYAKQVNHPGTPGNRPTHYKPGFMADSQREAERMIPTFAQSNLSRLFR